MLGAAPLRGLPALSWPGILEGPTMRQDPLISCKRISIFLLFKETALQRACTLKICCTQRQTRKRKEIL